LVNNVANIGKKMKKTEEESEKVLLFIKNFVINAVIV